MKLTQTGSLWGNMYRLRHYKNGLRISDVEFRDLFVTHIETNFQGTRAYRQTTSSFSIDWIIPDARSNESLLTQA